MVNNVRMLVVFIYCMSDMRHETWHLLSVIWCERSATRMSPVNIWTMSYNLSHKYIVSEIDLVSKWDIWAFTYYKD